MTSFEKDAITDYLFTPSTQNLDRVHSRVGARLIELSQIGGDDPSPSEKTQRDSMENLNDQLVQAYRSLITASVGEEKAPNVVKPPIVFVVPAGFTGRIVASATVSNSAQEFERRVTTVVKGREGNERPGEIIPAFGVGLGVTSSLGDKEFEVRPERYDDGTPVLQNGNQSYRIVSSDRGVNVFDAQLRVHYLFPDRFYNGLRSSAPRLFPRPELGRFGATFGSNVGGNNAYLLGLSYFPGENADFAITVGAYWKQVAVLRPGYQPGDSIFESTAPTQNRFKPGFFFGVSFNAPLTQPSKTTASSGG